MMDKIKDYKYSTLTNRSIRVLELSECDANEEILRGTLRQFSLVVVRSCHWTPSPTHADLLSMTNVSWSMA
jgi:hypothetical protein